MFGLKMPHIPPHHEVQLTTDENGDMIIRYRVWREYPKSSVTSQDVVVPFPKGLRSFRVALNGVLTAQKRAAALAAELDKKTREGR
jgi:hypothetical protein